MIIVDTSPLSAFLRMGRVELLRTLIGQVHIPGAVADELNRGRHLAVANQGRLVMDEVKGRQRRVIPEARPLLDELCLRGGLWIGDTLRREVLERLGEG